jgi:hypothetical protein
MEMLAHAKVASEAKKGSKFEGCARREIPQTSVEMGSGICLDQGELVWLPWAYQEWGAPVEFLGAAAKINLWMKLYPSKRASVCGLSV